MTCIEGDGRRKVTEIDRSKTVALIGRHTWDRVGYWIVLYAQSKGQWTKFTVEDICRFSMGYGAESLCPPLKMHSDFLHLFTDLAKAGHLSCRDGALYEVTTMFTQYQLVG